MPILGGNVIHIKRFDARVPLDSIKLDISDYKNLQRIAGSKNHIAYYDGEIKISQRGAENEDICQRF